MSDLEISLSEEEAFAVVQEGLRQNLINYSSRQSFLVTAISFDDEHSRMVVSLDRPELEKKNDD